MHTFKYDKSPFLLDNKKTKLENQYTMVYGEVCDISIHVAIITVTILVS